MQADPSSDHLSLNVYGIVWKDKHGEVHHAEIAAVDAKAAQKELRRMLNLKRMPIGSRTDLLAKGWGV